MAAPALRLAPARSQARQRGRAAIVHPYSTGRYLAPALAARGWGAVAVLPAQPLPAHDHPGSFRRRDYDAVITDEGSIAAIAAIATALDVTAVLPGAETGVPLADQLARSLGLAGNDPRTSPVRRDKGQMAAALAAAGVSHPLTIRAGTADRARAAARAIGGAVVVKPVASAGGEDVAVCRTAQEVDAAWQSAAGKQNLMGLRNDELLIQEFLDGQQYTINTVSCPLDGGRAHHYVAEVWLDHRREIAGGRVIYDRMDLLAGDDPRAADMGRYITRVLDALGVQTGPAHCEAVMTSRGPVLIEAGARLAGMGDPAATALALGTSQVDLAAEAITDPDGFTSRHRGPYLRHACAVQLDLAASRPGVMDPGAFAAISALASVRGWVGHVVPGGRVTRTVDLLTSPGTFYLTGAAEEVEADIAWIRELEQTELYQ
ncbi:MAG TPA: ATP-grasp domain-containing protein [Streptosporangiaceae bacterium]|jgi:biotin carboxylase